MIVWCDVETTGLFPEKDHLLEVALVVTDDDDLGELGFCCVTVKPVGVSIDGVPMDKKVVDMHTKNGLLDEIRAMEKSDGGGTRLHQAEQILLDFLTGVFKTVPPVASEKCAHCGRGEKDHDSVATVPTPTLLCVADGYYSSEFVPKLVPAVSQTPLAGSTIAFDRSFLRAHMTRLHGVFHYRSIDVSSITELARRWAPEVYEARPKNPEGALHRALADVRESIEYLRYFKRSGFVGAGECKYCRRVVFTSCDVCKACAAERAP